jgi:hypothetical protein
MSIHIAAQILLLLAIPLLPIQRILLALTPLLQFQTTRKISKKQASLHTSNTTLAKINEKDEFALWAKHRYSTPLIPTSRKRDKILSEIDLLTESLKSSTTLIKWIVKIICSVLTWLLITYLVFTNQTRAMIYLPGEWTGIVGGYLAMPSAPVGSVGVVVRD